MSRENVETMRQGFEAMSSGDLDRILAFVDPEFEAVVPPELSAEPDTYRGHEGIRRYFESFKDAMDDVRFEAERMWDAGENVVVTLRLSARGKETGIPVEQHAAQIWTLRDGRAIRARTYATLSEALDAVGLRDARPEEASSAPARSEEASSATARSRHSPPAARVGARRLS